jgi:hypothetical protein
MRTLYLWLANLVLIAHGLIVLFNIGALPIIWIGYFRGWNFVRSFAFRITHLSLIAFVLAESLLGAVCPLTAWENQWRVKAGVGERYERGFFAHWIHQLIFWDLDAKVFVTAYTLFLLLVVLTFVWVKPRRPRWGMRKT